MSGIFDKLRSSLGIGSSSNAGKTTGPGRVLGSGPGQAGVPSKPTASSVTVFDVSFPQPQLGMVLRSRQDNKPEVDDVVEGGSAEALGILPGDLIVGIEGNIVESYESFIEVVGAFGRPVTVRFSRASNGGQSRAAAPSSSSSSSSSSSRFGLGFTQKSAPPATAPLTEEEKDSRRAAMVKAAQDRGSAWDKRVAAASSKKKMSGKDDGRPVFDHDTSQKSSETARIVAAAKQSEQKAVREMGYNPFKPLLSSNLVQQPAAETTAVPFSGGRHILGGGGGSGGGGSGGLAQIGSSPRDREELDAIEPEDSEAVNAVNEALGMLLSAAEADSAGVQTAITTAAKMLKAAADSPDEAKFRCIRLANQNFQTKVASVPGGLELFLAAGFSVVQEASAATDGQVEAFLKHENDNGDAEQQLRYTLHRLADLQ